MASKGETAVDAQLTILECKRNAIFEYFQDVYDSIKNIENVDDQPAKNRFLSTVSNIEDMRSDYIEILDDYNKRLLAVYPNAAPSYKPLIAFEQLYSRVKSCREQFSKSASQSSPGGAPRKGRPSLPPIDLVSFDGDVRSWPLFYASFKSTIHEHPSLTDSEKLYYLLGKIGSKAQLVCAGITPSAENYELILQTLIDRYEDKRMLASTYLNQLFDFKPLTCASANNFELFLDKFVTAVKALQNLKLDDLCNLILLQIGLKKLDCETVRSFEMSANSSSIPTFESLVEFIQNQSKILQRTPAPSSSTKKVEGNSKPRAGNQPPKLHTFVNVLESKKCLCNFKHSHLFKCPAFNKISPEFRYKTAKQLGACFNCLSLKHMSSECQSNTHCSLCKHRHHSSLHVDKLPQQESNPRPAHATTPSGPPPVAVPEASASPTARPRTDVSLCTTSIAASNSVSAPAQHTAAVDSKQCNANTTVLLATAQVVVLDSAGRKQLVRCLLDSASQSNFITSECLNRLGIRPNDIPRIVVKGIGGSEKVIKGSACFEFYSRFKTNVKFEIAALIVDRITDNLPTESVDISALPPMEGLPLADDTFGTPRGVDVLLGAAVFPHLLLPGLVAGDASAPLAVETVLGFVWMGAAPTARVCRRGDSASVCTHRVLCSSVTACCCSIVPEQPINQQVNKSWELEELTAPRPQHPADVECEEFYRTTTIRDPVSGRYKVALPFRDTVDTLGKSIETTRKRFLCLEGKLESSPNLRSAYDQVIRDHLNQGYLTPAPADDSPAPAVIREDKDTTKLRIVLDASRKTGTEISSNDILHSGPNLQSDLFNDVPADVPEQKTLAHPVTSPAHREESVILALANRCSSWSKLLRSLVFVYRFLNILPRRESLFITATDLEFVEKKLLHTLQTKYFSNDFINLQNNRDCSSALLKLRPFVDNELIRVGGRLTNSELKFPQRHPVVLPRQDHVIDLLIDYYHRKYLHAGPELVMSLLRQNYWILSARRIIRQRIHKCNVCFRRKPRPSFPLMADLPDSRVRPVVKAFTHTGCDYAGPIAYTPIRRRGAKALKAYICVFTCLTTRAVHIECTTDLSTASFLAALKRFLSRRGPVKVLYSDNGTNFVGANSYLKDLYKFLNSEFRPRFEEELAENRIEWKFIPPASPHFGGCWESMVKIIKTHLFKVVGQQLLSYEELITVLAQIECILNSRPLTVLSSDPSEPTALTPSHFLHTAPLCSLPAPEVESGSILQRYNLLDNLVQSFWKRWRLEYLHGLQIRERWNTPAVPVAVGTVVVIIVDAAPPLAWPLGVVEKLHPSRDGTVRVVTVRTAKSTFLRPVVRLCPLPNQ